MTDRLKLLTILFFLRANEFVIFNGWAYSFPEVADLCSMTTAPAFCQF